VARALGVRQVFQEAAGAAAVVASRELTRGDREGDCMCPGVHARQTAGRGTYENAAGTSPHDSGCVPS
jgi:hypothetical protein